MLFVHNMCSLNKNLAATSALRRISDAGGPRLCSRHHDLAWTTPCLSVATSRRRSVGSSYCGATGPACSFQVTVSQARQQELAALFGVPVDRIGRFERYRSAVV